MYDANAQPLLSEINVPSLTTPEAEPEEALEFLRLLDGENAEFTFQTFGGPLPAQTLHGTFDKMCPDLLEKHNQGVNIAVTINATNGVGRTHDDIKRVRAVFADFDQGLPSDLPLPPSIVVRSSPSHDHAYWLVDQLAHDEFKAIERVLVEKCGADPNASDPARVFRLSGFLNFKHQPPCLVRRVGGNGRRYTQAEITTAFSPSPKADSAPGPLENNRTDLAVIRSALSRIDPEKYDNYLKVGMAIHDDTKGGDQGLALYREWASRSTKFDQRDLRAKWASFKSGGNGVTLGTLFAMARAGGWEGPHATKIT